MASDLEAAKEKAVSTSELITTKLETKDNIVDWDGPDDPDNPRNWPAWKRMTQVILASAFLLTAYVLLTTRRPR